MDVIFYGRLADRVGSRVHVDVPAERCSVAELRRLIASQHPQVADEISGPRVRACLDDVIAAEEQLIGEAHNVEFFPPVSGG